MGESHTESRAEIEQPPTIEEAFVFLSAARDVARTAQQKAREAQDSLIGMLGDLKDDQPINIVGITSTSAFFTGYDSSGNPNFQSIPTRPLVGPGSEPAPRAFENVQVTGVNYEAGIISLRRSGQKNPGFFNIPLSTVSSISLAEQTEPARV